MTREKTFRTLIVDDESHARENLEIMVQEYCPHLNPIHKASSVQEALTVLEEVHPEVIFLDIQMPGEDGFRMLEELDVSQHHVIFTTAFNEYAVRALKEGAFDYLEKPISIDDLERCAGRILENGSPSGPTQDFVKQLMHYSNLRDMDKTTIPTSDGFVVLKSSDIVRLEASESYTRIFLANEEKHLSSKNIRVFEDSLNPDIFFRTHKSHIVNILYHLRGFSRSEGNMAILSNGVKVPVSRRKLSDFLQRAGS